jgi:hypothetical protein
MFIVLIDCIGKTLQWLIKGMWMFERNDVVFHTLLGNIHVLFVRHYFRHIFVERHFVIPLWCSSHGNWVFLDNLKVNFKLPLNIQLHWVKYFNLVTTVIMLIRKIMWNIPLEYEFFFNKHVSKPLKHGKNFIINMFNELQNIKKLETWKKIL